ncbi:hypothetical protein JCM19237_6464 [Photobacterium aphoticum]|uniref:GlyGly-CTERM sorting domain-containing protein n=1 Tax=Photobacterium aphoticum TaxID=754436 RepID=A0A090QKB6_9GAMM|nr:hypothetical protein JCM19237_6464 [Photobacterium aphoticum]
MQQKTLKLSTLAILIAGATSANAAVYRVVEVTDSTALSSTDYYPNDVDQSLIPQRLEFHSKGIAASKEGENCFAGTCQDGADYAVIGEGRLGSEGVPYRDVVPYISDNYQEINDEDRLYNYCVRNLGPNTCDNWALTQYYGKGYNTNLVEDRSGLGGLVRVQEAWDKNYFGNATAVKGTSGFSVVDTFADDATGYADAEKAALGTFVDSRKTTNTVLNAEGTYSDGTYDLGVATGAYFEKDGRFARQFAKRGFVNVGETPLALNPVSNGSAIAKTAGQSLAYDAVEYPAGSGTLLVVGSGSFAQSDFNDVDNKVPDNRENRGDPIFSDSQFKECPSKFSAGLADFYGTKECQLSVFANDAVFWTVDSGAVAGEGYANLLSKRVDKNGNTYSALDPDDNDRSYQAGATAVSLVSNKPVVVGFTTDSVDKQSIDEANRDFYAIRASVWELPANTTDASAEAWKRTIIPGMPIEDSDGDRRLTYSLATDVNANNKVIGVAKNYRSDNRSYVERMFVYDNTAKPTAPTFLDSSKSPLFFSGANGYPAAINNHDQIVGKLDAETVNQVDGRFRRQRAFTYVMGDISSDVPEADKSKMALKQGDVYFLDDLVNDGNASGAANQYRIFEATDINDAGVISATAFKCEGGYDNLSSTSFCQGGAANSERTVAVKLIPIAASENPSVQARPEADSTIKRSGGSIGLLTLTVLGWLGFRRRK